MPARWQYSLGVGDDTRIPLRDAGLLLGRDARCDLVLADRSASRHHALIRRNAQGVVAVALGAAPLRVNDRTTRSAQLAPGDRVGVPGLELVLHAQEVIEPDAVWAVVLPGGVQVRVPAPGFAIGAGGAVAPAGWPPAAAVVQRVDAGGVAVQCGAPLLRNGFRLAPGATVELNAGDVLAAEGGDALELLKLGAGNTATLVGEDALPDEVRLTFLARGGRLEVELGGSTTTLWVPDRRFDLLMCLLAPPAPDAGGEAIGDEVVLRRIWPRSPTKSRVDLNVLLKRLRGDLEAAGLSGRLVVRAPGGGATQFRLAPGARVRVEPS